MLVLNDPASRYLRIAKDQGIRVQPMSKRTCELFLEEVWEYKAGGVLRPSTRLTLGSPPPSLLNLCVCMTLLPIHPVGKSCSDPGRVLVLSDPRLTSVDPELTLGGPRLVTATQAKI